MDGLQNFDHLFSEPGLVRKNTFYNVCSTRSCAALPILDCQARIQFGRVHFKVSRFVIHYILSVISAPWSVVRHPWSMIRRPSYVICRASSVILDPWSVIRHVSSIIRCTSSVVCQPSSVIQQFFVTVGGFPLTRSDDFSWQKFFSH